MPKIHVSLPDHLLTQANKVCADWGMTRSKLIQAGLAHTISELERAKRAIELAAKHDLMGEPRNA